MLRLFGLLGIGGLILAVLAACGGSSPPVSELLALAKDKPTLAFFFIEA